MVKASREARLEIKVIGNNGERRVSAIVDTGFTGFLTLPSRLIHDLEFQWQFREQAVLGSGELHVFDVFSGIVDWSGGPMAIAILASEATPLVGMSLMGGHKLVVDAVEGGTVTLDRLGYDSR